MKKLNLFLLPLCISFIAFAQTPQLVKNINSNATPDQYSHSNAQKGILFNGQLYFAAENNQGVELWKTNGTMAGTLLTRDLFSFSSGSSAFPREFIMQGGNLYFFVGDTAQNATENSRIYKMDVSGNISYVAGGVFNPKGMILFNF